MNALSPNRRAAALDELRTALRSVTLQELRSAARLWNWPVKGAAKADVIEYLMEHLGNASEMAAAFRTFTPAQQQAAIWLARLGYTDDQGEMLRTAISCAEGRELSRTTITRALGELRQRLIMIISPSLGQHIPSAYLEWLPTSGAPAMVYRGQPTPGGRPNVLPMLGPDQLEQHIEHLLALIEHERPAVLRPAPSPPTANSALSVQPHPGIVSDAFLAHGGYNDADERNLARTLLSILLTGGLCRVQEPDGRLTLDAAQTTAWRDLASEARLADLRAWWTRHNPIGFYVSGGPMQPIWDELDMVLSAQTTYGLRKAVNWMDRQALDNQIKIVRAWLVQLLQVFQEDVWFSFARLLELLAGLRRDLLQWTPYQMIWTWYEGEIPLATAQMNQRVWAETYGALIEACLAGPASWLGYVQVAVENDHVVAFMRPGAAAGAAATPLAADTLRFLPDGQFILRNSWRASDLRQIIRQVAAETARDRETTTYALSAEAFRQTLLAGQSADQVIAMFAAAGFALPTAHADRLREWQARLGRHQLYDNLGVIEFKDDETLAEVQATTGLGRADLYPISPRCLVVLRPEVIPDLLEELRRKGYTPQVLQ